MVAQSHLRSFCLGVPRTDVGTFPNWCDRARPRFLAESADEDSLSILVGAVLPDLDPI